MDTFAEALDRMDVDIDDFASRDLLREKLAEVLRVAPTGGQMEAAVQHLAFVASQTQMAAIEQGLFVDYFERRGRGVAALRDERGRFVTEGGRRIQDRLARGAG